MLSVLGYASTAWILLTYGVLARTGKVRAFHLANAVGCVPIGIGEVLLGAYVPLVLTASFGALGWLGLFKGRA